MLEITCWKYYWKLFKHSIKFTKPLHHCNFILRLTIISYHFLFVPKELLHLFREYCVPEENAGCEGDGEDEGNRKVPASSDLFTNTAMSKFRFWMKVPTMHWSCNLLIIISSQPQLLSRAKYLNDLLRRW